MLIKFLKHDMRAMYKKAMPLFIASGIVSIICCAILYFTFSFNDEINSILNAVVLTGSFYILGIFAIFIMWAIVAFSAVGRYYKSFFCDEGYLNMTLPVECKTIFRAKLLFVIIWVTLASLVAFASAVISVILPTLLYDTSLISSAMKILWHIVGINFNATPTVIIASIIKILVKLLSSIKTVFIVITAIHVGSAIVSKHKIFASVIFYFAINFAEEIVMDVAKFIFNASFIADLSIAFLWYSIFSLIVTVLIIALMYHVSLYMLKNKFSIE